MRERPIKHPNLPEGKVKRIAVGEGNKHVLRSALERLDIEVLWLPENLNTDKRLSSHADLSLIHVYEDRYFCDSDLVNLLTINGVVAVPCSQGIEIAYPKDAILNACVVGEYFIHNINITDKALYDFVRDKYKVIHVKQGYSKCNICVVDECSIITSDVGIARAAQNHGLEILQIGAGSIELTGFDCGFLGGSTFKLAPDKLAFTGRIDRHPDFDAIMRFLSVRCIEPVILTDRAVFDIGSAVLLTELI